MKTDLFINNDWVAAASGDRFPVVNPATEAVIADVSKADADDVDVAVDAAQACFESDEWRSLNARDRGKMLMKAADLLAARTQDVAELETRQNGKLLFESKIDVAISVDTLRYYGGWADKITGDTLPVSGPFFAYTLREPVGVVGAIVPWNFPLNIATWKYAPALAAGCTVVLKPASETPLTALAVAEVMLEAGFPPGAFNVVPGGGSTAGNALVKHPGVDKNGYINDRDDRCVIATGNVNRDILGVCPTVPVIDGDGKHDRNGLAGGEEV